MQGVLLQPAWRFNHIAVLSFFIISELDHDAFPFSNLEECFPSDDKGIADG